MDPQTREIDFSRFPYKGIISEVAREEGVSTAAISASFKNGNPAIREKVAHKVAEARQREAETNRLLYGDNDTNEGGQP